MWKERSELPGWSCRGGDCNLNEEEFQKVFGCEYQEFWGVIGAGDTDAGATCKEVIEAVEEGGGGSIQSRSHC